MLGVSMWGAPLLTTREDAMIGMFPLLLLAVLAYSAVAVMLGGPDIASMEAFLAKEVMSIPLLSDVSWSMKVSDLFVISGLALLFVEIVQATRIGRSSIINHSLSMGVFVLALIEFLGFQKFGTSTFFILMMLALMDVIAGFTITIRTARRDIGFGGLG